MAAEVIDFSGAVIQAAIDRVVAAVLDDPDELMVELAATVAWMISSMGSGAVGGQ
ncbi:hypothetical protein AB0D33_08360 [Streptomyces sp. NPDC048404]|uniref:hypothetical protein n=1 Tax=unclassified Streptomyces TaxID=2593676 RepID=UPI00342854BE